MGHTSPTSGSSDPPVEEFGCRTSLVASLPLNAGIDGCNGSGDPSGGGGNGTVDSTNVRDCGNVDPNGDGCEYPDQRGPGNGRFQTICVFNYPGEGGGGGGGAQGSTGGCSGLFCGYTPSIGNKLVQLGAPNSGAVAPHVSLTYNALSTESTFFGFGFSDRHARWIEELDSSTAEIHRGDGRVFTYGNKSFSGVYTPPPGANSKLAKTGSTWVETRPNGFKMEYNSTGDLVKTTNVAGSITTLLYTGTPSRLETIIDPFGGRTTYAYDDIVPIGFETTEHHRSSGARNGVRDQFQRQSGEVHVARTLCDKSYL